MRHKEKASGGTQRAPGAFPHAGGACVYRLAEAGLRPPPWLALPPLLAISRCLAGSIAAKPRFDPPLLVAAIFSLLVGRLLRNAIAEQRLPKLMEVRERPLSSQIFD